MDALIEKQLSSNKDLVAKLVELQSKAGNIQDIADPDDYRKAMGDLDEQLFAVVKKLPPVRSI